MHVEIDGAVEIARTAASFNWSWTDADLVRFCQALDWQVTRRRPKGARLATNLGVNRPRADVSITDGSVREIMVWVSDIPDTVDDAVSAAIGDGYEEIHARIEGEFGPPTRTVFGEAPRAGWYLPDVVIFLGVMERSLDLCLVNPESQRLRDVPEQVPRIWKF
ncbi:DUF6301 family protein [Nocardia heshunensis]